MSNEHTAKGIAEFLEKNKPGAYGFSHIAGDTLKEWARAYPEIEKLYASLYLARCTLPNDTSDSLKWQREAALAVAKALRKLGTATLSFCDERAQWGACNEPVRDGVCLHPECHLAQS